MMTIGDMIKCVVLTTIIVWCIGFGIVIMDSFRFWGIFNYLVGSLSVCFLSWQYYKNKKESSK